MRQRRRVAVSSTSSRRHACDDDWDWIDWPTPLSVGFASGADDGDGTDTSMPVLWVPDPEQRHGWREFYCAKPKPAPGPGMGFAYGGRK